RSPRGHRAHGGVPVLGRRRLRERSDDSRRRGRQSDIRSAKKARRISRSRRTSMPKMRVVQVSRPGGPLEMVEREIPQPGPREVRVKVQACGLCHSDSLTKEGLFPGITYPRVPGHEIAGVIDAVGSEVPRWKIG